MNILEIGKSSSVKTEFSGFFGIFSVGFFNTDVGVGFGFSKYRDIGFGYRLGSSLGPGLECPSPTNMQIYFLYIYLLKFKGTIVR